MCIRDSPDLEICDRVGGGDSFVAGLAYGFLSGLGPARAVEYGTAHGALAMTTPGDTSMATLAEVEHVMRGGGARVARYARRGAFQAPLVARLPRAVIEWIRHGRAGRSLADGRLPVAVGPSAGPSVSA